MHEQYRTRARSGAFTDDAQCCSSAEPKALHKKWPKVSFKNSSDPNLRRKNRQQELAADGNGRFHFNAYDLARKCGVRVDMGRVIMTDCWGRSGGKKWRKETAR